MDDGPPSGGFHSWKTFLLQSFVVENMKCENFQRVLFKCEFYCIFHIMQFPDFVIHISLISGLNFWFTRSGPNIYTASISDCLDFFSYFNILSVGQPHNQSFSSKTCLKMLFNCILFVCTLSKCEWMWNAWFWKNNFLYEILIKLISYFWLLKVSTFD